MTLRELKNKILLALYERYKEGNTSHIEFDKLCSLYSIIYDSEKQLADAFESLHSNNYLTATFLINNKGIIHGLTPEGVHFIEEHLLTDEDLIADSLRDTDTYIKSGHKLDLDIDGDSISNDSAPSVDQQYSVAFTPKESYQDIKDSSVNPCFGIDKLAECYIKQLDKIAEHTNDNFCMLGIFGPWGRGKSYFFKQVKKGLSEREKNKKSQPCINYKIIEFNAWKYQDTPAIWAYLYEVIYKHGLNWFQRLLFYVVYQLKHQWIRMLSYILFFVLVCLLYNKISTLQELSNSVKSVMQELKLPLAWFTAASGLFYAIIKNPFSILNSIEKKLKRRSYKGMLGIQNDLEQDLVSLINYIVCNNKLDKKQIILYVDDIDRCESSKMLEIVNSLRLILEHPDIQKRMIVICSVDANKLKNAYCANKNHNDSVTEKLLKDANRHLDKLFVFSIGLAPLDKFQQIEFLDKLVVTDEEVVENTSEVPFSINREKHSLFVHTEDAKIEDLNESKIKALLIRYIKEKNIEGLTPRKIRIIFYRLLFANNIIAAGNGYCTEDTLNNIISASLNDNPEIETAMAFSDVIKMVVPY